MNHSIKKIKSSLLISCFAIFSIAANAQAEYWLVLGSFRQGPGSRPEVSGITSPSLYAIPMASMKLCQEAGKKISEEIYMPVWQFDNRWTCIYDGK